jgi:hypothetical protein
LTPSDFEMLEGGVRIKWGDYECNRTPIAD